LKILIYDRSFQSIRPSKRISARSDFWTQPETENAHVYLARLLRYSASKITGVMTLTFWGHVTSSVTWPFDSPCGVSYRWSTLTMRLSGTVNEIFSFEDIGVTTLTIWGHVTSSVTW